jgi:hypothetical protein
MVSVVIVEEGGLQGGGVALAGGRRDVRWRVDVQGCQLLLFHCTFRRYVPGHHAG